MPRKVEPDPAVLDRLNDSAPPPPPPTQGPVGNTEESDGAGAAARSSTELAGKEQESTEGDFSRILEFKNSRNSETGDSSQGGAVGNPMSIPLSLLVGGAAQYDPEEDLAVLGLRVPAYLDDALELMVMLKRQQGIKGRAGRKYSKETAILAALMGTEPIPAELIAGTRDQRILNKKKVN